MYPYLYLLYITCIYTHAYIYISIYIHTYVYTYIICNNFEVIS